VRKEWLAFQLQSEYNRDIAENLNLKVRYLLFTNLQTLALNTIDHRLDMSLTAKVTKYDQRKSDGHAALRPGPVPRRAIESVTGYWPGLYH
jgi:hypothetical protein